MSTFSMGEDGMPIRIPTEKIHELGDYRPKTLGDGPRGMPQPQRLTAGQCRYCGHLIIALQDLGWGRAAGAEYPLRCDENAEGHKPITKPPALTDRDALEAWLDD